MIAMTSAVLYRSAKKLLRETGTRCSLPRALLRRRAPPPHDPHPPPPQTSNDEMRPTNFGRFSPLLTVRKKNDCPPTPHPPPPPTHPPTHRHIHLRVPHIPLMNSMGLMTFVPGMFFKIWDHFWPLRKEKLAALPPNGTLSHERHGGVSQSSFHHLRPLRAPFPPTPPPPPAPNILQSLSYASRLPTRRYSWCHRGECRSVGDPDTCGVCRSGWRGGGAGGGSQFSGSVPFSLCAKLSESKFNSNLVSFNSISFHVVSFEFNSI